MSAKKFSFKINSTAAQHDKQHDILIIDSNISWDNFLAFSKWLISSIDAQFISHDIGADLHRVTFEFEETRLHITFEETSNSLWIALDNNSDIEVLAFIESLLKNL